MASVLFFEVANFIVELLKIVLEGNHFILGSSDRVFKAEYVLVPLILHLSLVPNPILRRLYLRLQTLHRMPRCLIRIILGLTSLSQFCNFFGLAQVRLLVLSQLAPHQVNLALL